MKKVGDFLNAIKRRVGLGFRRLVRSGKCAPKDTITILTKPPRRLLSFNFFKKNLYFDDTNQVLRSLDQGLKKLKANYRINPWWWQTTESVGVIANKKALKWALKAKKAGKVKRIIAGPDIVISPQEDSSLITNPNIDQVILSSDWQKDWWTEIDQYFMQARIWSAGVEDTDIKRKENGLCLIYSKLVDEGLFKYIIRTLWNKKISIIVFKHKYSSRAKYLRFLKKAKFVVYLSKFEKHGLSLKQAWLADIPTLVWDKGSFKYKGDFFEGKNIGSPHLVAECGGKFHDEEDFESALSSFLEKYLTFQSEKYAHQLFTDEVAASQYLKIFRETGLID